MEINWVIKESHRIAKEKGFWSEERDKGTLIALMHSELSETLEALRRSFSDDKVAEELADCVIRIADYCAAYGLDLEKAIKKKMRFNEKRKWKHGKRF